MSIINRVKAVFHSIYERPPEYYSYNRAEVLAKDDTAADNQVDIQLQSDETGDTDLWVFGYGSLMWNPDFQFIEKFKARAHGVQRSFCIQSILYRGSKKKPGLVLGLNRGSQCEGVAFRVAGSEAKKALANLRKREQITNVYREVFRSVELNDGTGRRVRALCFIANESHKYYTGRLSPSQQAAIIKHSRGKSGSNLDYLISTIKHLDELGISNDQLRRILILTGCSYRMA